MDLGVEAASICQYLEQKIGWQYFQQQSEALKKQDPDGIGLGRSLVPFSQQSLGYLWLKTQEELIMGQLSGNYRPGYAAIRLLALGRELKAGEGKVAWQPLLELLPEQVELGAFIVHWAVLLSQKGHTVQIKTNPAGEIYLQTEDFLWRGRNCSLADWQEGFKPGNSAVRELWAFNFQSEQILDFEQESWQLAPKEMLKSNPNLIAIILSQSKLDSGNLVRTEKLIFQGKQGDYYQKTALY